MSDTPTVCINLDKTSGMECAFQGPYNFSRNKPTLAILTSGISHALGCLREGVPFLMCQPAEDMGLQPDHDRLAELQRHCSRYQERK